MSQGGQNVYLEYVSLLQNSIDNGKMTSNNILSSLKPIEHNKTNIQLSGELAQHGGKRNYLRI